jgi:hypothetical protein
METASGPNLHFPAHLLALSLFFSFFSGHWHVGPLAGRLLPDAAGW